MYDKKDALYIKAPVIINGITDRQGDVVSGSDNIKKIKTNFGNQNLFDIDHKRIPMNDVSIEENYINEMDEFISGFLVPTGSWIDILKVDNPMIKEQYITMNYED
ncbi:MAG: XkdF-like putative serine protease domain-containing protein [Methanobacteriaceae archaeon]|jgi:hypothetical protein|nr:XkdF-like putative serine protease domain-containing protein [Candidatus Methanorudis spinitermitis]